MPSKIMDMDNCVLVGSDKSAGTVPVYISPIKNRILGYTLSSILFIAILSAGCFIFNKEVREFFTKPHVKTGISIASLVTFFASILFYLNAGYKPVMVFFSIMGIMLSSVAMFLFLDTSIFTGIDKVFMTMIKIISQCGRFIVDGIGNGLLSIVTGFVAFCSYINDNRTNSWIRYGFTSFLIALLTILIYVFIAIYISKALSITLAVFIAILGVFTFATLFILFLPPLQ
jgi:hypothetical protein